MHVICVIDLVTYGLLGSPSKFFFKTMKHVYINTAEDRISTISAKAIPELQADPALVEYKVSDDFDFDLIIKDDDGNDIRITGGITAAEFIKRHSGDYVQQRVDLYPEITEQLDMLWHAMDADPAKRLEPFYSSLKTIKEDNPKPAS